MQTIFTKRILNLVGEKFSIREYVLIFPNLKLFFWTHSQWHYKQTWVDGFDICYTAYICIHNRDVLVNLYMLRTPPTENKINLMLYDEYPILSSFFATTRDL